MPKIEGLKAIRKRLLELRRETPSGVSAVVGYTQSYAVYVHEDLNARHAEGKTAKYLEGPARQLSPVLADIVKTVYLRTNNLGQSLVMACLRLQRESQQIVPIDTGALKASAFTALDKDVDKESAVAFARSQAIRNAAKK